MTFNCNVSARNRRAIFTFELDGNRSTFTFRSVVCVQPLLNGCLIPSFARAPFFALASSLVFALPFGFACRPGRHTYWRYIRRISAPVE